MTEKVLDRNNAIGLLDLNGQDFYVKDTLQMIYPSAYRPSGRRAWLEFKGSGVCEKVFARKNVVGLWLQDPYERFAKTLKISDAISKKTRIVRFELADDEYEDHGLMWAYQQKYLEVQVDEWNAEEARKERMPAMAPEQRKDLGSVLREWKASDVRRKETLTPRYHSIQ